MAQVEHIIGQTNSNTRRIWVRGRGREGKEERGREGEGGKGGGEGGKRGERKGGKGGRGGRDRVELGNIPVLLLCYDINALLSRGIKKEA